jgi:predicted CopG family antitoxin
MDGKKSRKTKKLIRWEILNRVVIEVVVTKKEMNERVDRIALELYDLLHQLRNQSRSDVAEPYLSSKLIHQKTDRDSCSDVLTARPERKAYDGKDEADDAA